MKRSSFLSLARRGSHGLKAYLKSAALIILIYIVLIVIADGILALSRLPLLPGTIAPQDSPTYLPTLAFAAGLASIALAVALRSIHRRSLFSTFTAEQSIRWRRILQAALLYFGL